MKRIWMAGAVACALMTSVIPAKAFGDHAEHARMRHDRPCDKFQDRKDLWKLSPRGGNAVRFGLCGGIEDIPIGANTSPGGFWGAYNCG